MGKTKRFVQDAGYEVLWVMGIFLAGAVYPTRKTIDDVWELYCDSSLKRQQLRRLEDRGLIKSEIRGGRWVGAVTELGYAVFCGGRDPETRWNREWDGKWRLLSFDLPRKEHRRRLKFVRWLAANHFGRVQGSVWVCPDPVPEIGDVVRDEEIHPRKMMVFEGVLTGMGDARKVSEAAWDFESINAAYRVYLEFADGFRVPGAGDISGLLREERRIWWEAVRQDPLLPRELLPKGYMGEKAWKTRRKLLGKLHKKFLSKMAVS